jgi:ribonucleotide monophosphatase NagD (HAD superfamily)
VIPGVAEMLDTLKRVSKKVLFVTNNSSKSRFGLLKKFNSLDLQVNADGIFSCFMIYVLFWYLLTSS